MVPGSSGHVPRNVGLNVNRAVCTCAARHSGCAGACCARTVLRPCIQVLPASGLPPCVDAVKGGGGRRCAFVPLRR